MTSVAVSQNAIETPAGLLAGIFNAVSRRLAEPGDFNIDPVSKRQILLEMIHSHPEAFQGEADFHAMSQY